ncbi:hypothetical protein ABZ345_05930 [Lentzea sp. NPDC005914]
MAVDMRKRTCPWCTVTHVWAVTEERLTIALSDHLKECQGDGSQPRDIE